VETDSDTVKLNKPAKRLGQTSFRSTFKSYFPDTQTYRQPTYSFTWTTSGR